jgi:hypothetical protein
MLCSQARHPVIRCWLAGCVVLGSSLMAAGCGGSSLAGSTGSRPSQPSQPSRPSRPGVLSARLGPARRLAAPVNGSNLDYSGVGQPFSARGVITALQAFRPGTLRYPGGTIANYWSWQTGTVDQPAQTADHTAGTTFTYGFTLQTLRSIVRETGTTPVFDLNVLTSSLPDQLAMLERARALGIPVRYIELGNEFYYSSNSYTSVFPTAAAYADLVARWAPRIRASFPGAQIAAVGSLPQATPRERSWNSTVLSVAGRDISALTLHDYTDPQQQGHAGAVPVSDVLASTYSDWQQTQKVMAAIPARYQIWFTEFNLSNGARAMGSPPLGVTWAHGLYAADMMLLFDQSARVGLDEYWELLSDLSTGVYTGGPDPSLTAAGSALIALTNASWDASSVTSLSFPGAPALDGSAPGVVGVSFTGPHGTRTVLLNLTDHAVPVAADAVIPRGAVAESISGNPAAEVSGTTGLTRHIGMVGSSLLLPAYAVVTVGFSAPTG